MVTDDRLDLGNVPPPFWQRCGRSRSAARAAFRQLIADCRSSGAQCIFGNLQQRQRRDVSESVDSSEDRLWLAAQRDKACRNATREKRFAFQRGDESLFPSNDSRLRTAE